MLFNACNDLPKKEKSSSPVKQVAHIKDTTNVQQTSEIDAVVEKEGKQKTNGNECYFYPNMSFCGGALYGIYNKGELIRIESNYGADLGYSSRDIDFKNGKIRKIVYREHFAEWEQYAKTHSPDVDINLKEMTYSDTLYILEFGKVNTFKKYAGKKLISTKEDPDLRQHLLDCVETMKKELGTEKQLVK
jgi:hypothetical protein